MAEVLLFHHAQGLTPGVLAFAEELRRAGHTVHTPDLYEGHVFDTLAEGAGRAEKIGLGTIIERGEAAAEGWCPGVVVAGFSLGVLPAQKSAQTRPGAKGALLLEACLPITEFGEAWSRAVPVQIHGMDADEFFVGEGDIAAARALVESAPGAELFLYPGDRHLFTDRSLPGYDANATQQLMGRVLDFLRTVGGGTDVGLGA